MKRKAVPSKNIGLKMFGGLASISKEIQQPWLPHDCIRKPHIWIKTRFNRRCSRCGREEEKNPATGQWEHF